MFSRHLSTLLIGLIALSSQAQNSASDTNRPIVFRANARTVVIDVVVTGKNGRPVQGLHQEDFLAAEDGHPQKITAFEEHAGSASLPVKLPALPPNVFTNVPRFTATDSVTVLLLDSLNTPIVDQGAVHAQTMKYLRGLQPGRRFAIFALGRQLRYVQGFTDDPALLAAALKSQTRGGGPQSSAMLTSYTEENAAAQAIAHLSDAGGNAASSVAGLKNAAGAQKSFQQDQRVLMTLDAFQQLAKYLSAIPGRKNVVWFSSAFPMVVFADPRKDESLDIERDFGDQFKETDKLLAAAQVAIYPIAAEGLAGDSLYDTQHDLLAPGGGYGARQQSGQSLQDDASKRNADHTTMEEIARDTGGEAIYNTNDLNDAIDRADNHGTHYYTLFYTPTNTSADGQFRNIQVKLASGSYKMAYRRGYFAEDAPKPDLSGKKVQDPLLHSMLPGLPNSTEVLFAIRIQTLPAAQPRTIAGENAGLKGPLGRCTVSLVIAASGLSLDPDSGGGRQGRIETTIIAYDQDGKPVNWIVRQVDLTMDPARFAQVQANGINLDLTIDLPKIAMTLRTGVYDWSSQRTGTLETPLIALATR